MKKILITAGPTNEYIDEVMKITNMSTGRLGIELTNELSSRGYEVTLVCTRSVTYNSLYFKYGLENNPLVKTVKIETTDQMLMALADESTSGTVYNCS